MKWTLVLFLALGILVGTGATRAALLAEKEKDEKKADKEKEKDAPKDKGKEKEKEAPKEKEKDKPKEDEKPTKEQEAELKALSGVFGVTVFERDGKKSPEDDLKKMKVTQDGAKWSFAFGDEITEGLDKVFPDKKPKAIDSTYTNGPAKGRTVQGIYEIDGDSVKYCWGEPGKDRPKEFKAPADSGFTLMVLKKGAAPKEKEPKEKEKGKEKEKDKDAPKEKEKG